MYEGVERYVMCHKEPSVSVVLCVGGGQGSLRCEGREGELKL